MIRKAITYFVVVTALLYGIRFVHYRGLLIQEKGYYGKYKTAFLEANDFNVLFLGSSRAEMHYNIFLFDSLTGNNSFNLSLAGASPQLAYSALRAYLANSKVPKELYYEVDFHSMNYEANEIKEFNNYFPFFKNAVLLEHFNRIDNRMKHFHFNPYYSLPFTGQRNLSTSLHGWLNIPNESDKLYYKGFVGENRRPRLDFIMVKPEEVYIHPSQRKYLNSIINLSKKLNIHLTLVTSPMFAGGKTDVANKEQILKQVKNIAMRNKINYWDFSSMPFSNRRDYFIDHFHMNASGAREFTLKFSRFYNNNKASRPLN